MSDLYDSDEYLQPGRHPAPLVEQGKTVSFRGRYASTQPEPGPIHGVWKSLLPPAVVAAVGYTVWAVLLLVQFVQIFNFIGAAHEQRGGPTTSDSAPIGGVLVPDMLTLERPYGLITWSLWAAVPVVAVLAVVLAWWLWRAYRNLDSSGVKGLPLSAPWALCALVPVVNVVVVAVLAAVTVQLSRSASWYGKRWQVQPGLREVLGWVVFTVLGAVFTLTGVLNLAGPNAQAPLWPMYVLLVGAAGNLAGCVCGAVLLGRTSWRLEHR